MSEEKPLGATHTPEATLLPLLLTGRAVALFNQVVLPLSCRDGDMFASAQLRNLSERGTIAPKSIRDDPLRKLLIVN